MSAVGMSAHGMLHNMSARPRTEITREVPLVQDGWVLFDLQEYRQNRSGERWEEPGPLTAAERRHLDACWHALGLTGATLIVRSRVQLLVDPIVCLDDDLIVNVILRARGDLLIHRMPLLDRRDVSMSNAVLVPDLRLRDHVVATGRYRTDDPRWS
jgi:hypothetical protein